MRWLLFLGAVCQASQIYCMKDPMPSLFCQGFQYLAPDLKLSNFPGVAGGLNASRAWVINSGDDVVIPAGSHTPGNSTVSGGQTVFVMGTGRMTINGSSGGEVAIAAHLVFCDDSQIVFHNANLRLAQDFEFQYFVWGANRASVVAQGLNLTTLSAAVVQRDPNQHGNSIWYFRENSTFTTSASAEYPYAIRHVRPMQDVMQLASLDNATVHVRDHQIVMETYVAGTARLIMENCTYHDTFLVVCSGNSLTLSGLPPLCNLSAGECLTSAQTPVSFTVGPPQVPFTFHLNNSLLFSLGIELRQNSVLAIPSAPNNANIVLAFGFEGDSLPPFAGKLAVSPPEFSLFSTTHNVTLGAGVNVAAYMLWIDGPNFDLTLTPGSEVGDVLTTMNNVTFRCNGTLLRNGQLIIRQNAYGFANSTLIDALRVDEGGWAAFSHQSVLNGVVTFFHGNVVLYDTALPSKPPVWLVGEGVSFLCSAAIGPFPLTSLSIEQTMNVTLNYACYDGYTTTYQRSGTGVTPTATLELVHPNNDVSVIVTNVTADVTVPLSLSSLALSPGKYELRFGVNHSSDIAKRTQEGFASVRYINIAPAAPTQGVTTSGGGPQKALSSCYSYGLMFLIVFVGCRAW